MLSLDTFEEFSQTEETGSIVEGTSDHFFTSRADFEGNEKDWEFNPDGNNEGDVDATWDEDNEEANKSTSNASSITLSSKASKRGFEEVDSDGEDNESGGNQLWSPAGSPGTCYNPSSKKILTISQVLNARGHSRLDTFLLRLWIVLSSAWKGQVCKGVETEPVLGDTNELGQEG